MPNVKELLQYTDVPYSKRQESKYRCGYGVARHVEQLDLPIYASRVRSAIADEHLAVNDLNIAIRLRAERQHGRDLVRDGIVRLRAARRHAVKMENVFEYQGANCRNTRDTSGGSHA